MTTQEIITRFNMQHNDAEGGYYATTFDSGFKVDNSDLPGFKPLPDKREMGSAIYYLLGETDISYLHQVKGDMVYNFYSGDPVEMLILYPEGSPQPYEICVFSNDLDTGGSPMKHIPAGAWLGSHVIEGGSCGYALMGVVLVPGFNPADYAIGDRADLISQYPEAAALITLLTKS